jgi:hypothetical protein
VKTPTQNPTTTTYGTAVESRRDHDGSNLERKKKTSATTRPVQEEEEKGKIMSKKKTKATMTTKNANNGSPQHNKKNKDPSSTTTTLLRRNMGWYRILIFGILLWEWNMSLPHNPVVVLQEMNNSMSTLAAKNPKAATAASTTVTNDWFTYDQFQFCYDWAPSTIVTTRLMWLIGNVAGIVAMCGRRFRLPMTTTLPNENETLYALWWFQIAGTIMVLLYCFRFFTYVQMFTNHNYLFALLGTLSILSGGGRGGSSSRSISDQTTTKQHHRRRRQQMMILLLQRCEWMTVTIRLQYAILYFFAALWKLHPDWRDGHIVQGILLQFEKQNVHRGVPWQSLHQSWPGLFRYVARIGGLLDFGMFVALTFMRPTHEHAFLFTVLSILFHVFVAITMSQRIGYTFPTACLAGTLLFQPLLGGSSNADDDDVSRRKKDDDYDAKQHPNGRPPGPQPEDWPPAEDATTVSAAADDPDAVQPPPPPPNSYGETNLLGWIWRYGVTGQDCRASKWQRALTILWLLVQILLPLRMLWPAMIEGGSDFPYTGRNYRFSWTMMLHSRETTIQHVGLGEARERKVLNLDLMYLVPECHGQMLLRKDYLPASAHPLQDPRTVPLHTVLAPRQYALISVFPRYLARVALGLSELLYQFYPNGCGAGRVGMGGGGNSSTGSQQKKVAVYGVHYAKLNGHGAYHRLFDPTVDLASATRERHTRSWSKFWLDVVLDRAPGSGRDYILERGIGSSSDKMTEYERRVKALLPPSYSSRRPQHIEYVADRMECLAARPLALWTEGYPVGILVLEVPDYTNVYVVERNYGHSPIGRATKTTMESQWDGLSITNHTVLESTQSYPHGTQAMSLEIGLTVKSERYGNRRRSCAETEGEDVVLALLFLV